MRNCRPVTFTYVNSRTDGPTAKKEKDIGLLDSILGSLGGGSAQGGSPLLKLALQLVQQNGGLEGLLAKLQQAGLADKAASWVGTGENLPVSADELGKALGAGSLGDLAGKLGLSQGDALSGLTSLLPTLVDKMTPGGQVPAEGNDILSQVLASMSDQPGRR